MADLRNHRVLLAQRPEGLVRDDDFTHDVGDVPEPGDGEVLVRTEWVGIDATVRTWLSKAEGYIPPVEIGEVVRSSGIGRVVASKSPKIAEGALVATLTGWQEYAVVGDDPMLTTPLHEGTDPLAALGVFGANGLTAYVGLTDIGQVQEGETVVVSAAAGATGSIAVQIAKILGARVIGIAGTDEKCAWLVDGLGLDGAINHKTDDIGAKLKEMCPKRVDVFFDNTGGPILDHVLGRLADHARVVLCGAISSYNDAFKPPGPPNYLNLISRRARMEGFISWDAWGRYGEIMEILGVWVADGRLQHRSHIFDGLEAAPQALNAMFTGENIGKIVVRVGGT
ncbi:MAG: NADP-dependent oxidoreductase [Acidimicrobiales bacterium]